MDSAFVCPLYRGRVAFNHRVLYIVTLYALAAFFQRYFPTPYPPVESQSRKSFYYRRQARL